MTSLLPWLHLKAVLWLRWRLLGKNKPPLNRKSENYLIALVERDFQMHMSYEWTQSIFAFSPLACNIIVKRKYKLSFFAFLIFNFLF